MPRVFTSKSQRIGKIGEEIAVKFLTKGGFVILSQNMTFKYGEIDILAIDSENVVHFIEVKSVRRELGYTCNQKKYYRPEENLNKTKSERLKKTILSQLSFRDSVLYRVLVNNQDRFSPDAEIIWQFDLIVVYIDFVSKKAKIEPIWNIIL